MKIVIYGDFGCPYSYLASLRADELLESGAAEIDWRAVAPDPSRPGGSRDELGRDLAAISLFAQPGERLPRPAAGPVDERGLVVDVGRFARAQCGVQRRAGRGLGGLARVKTQSDCRLWAESGPTGIASGRTGVRAIGVVPLRARK